MGESIRDDEARGDPSGDESIGTARPLRKH